MGAALLLPGLLDSAQLRTLRAVEGTLWMTVWPPFHFHAGRGTAPRFSFHEHCTMVKAVPQGDIKWQKGRGRM